jgi:Type III flagellar switch regulator (C-ring) FliN C-term
MTLLSLVPLPIETHILKTFSDLIGTGTFYKISAHTLPRLQRLISLVGDDHPSATTLPTTSSIISLYSSHTFPSRLMYASFLKMFLSELGTDYYKARLARRDEIPPSNQVQQISAFNVEIALPTCGSMMTQSSMTIALTTSNKSASMRIPQSRLISYEIVIPIQAPPIGSSFALPSKGFLRPRGAHSLFIPILFSPNIFVLSIELTMAKIPITVPLEIVLGELQISLKDLLAFEEGRRLECCSLEGRTVHLRLQGDTIAKASLHQIGETCTFTITSLEGEAPASEKEAA